MTIEIIDYSLLLEYAVAYCGGTETYICFSPVINDTVLKLADNLLEYEPKAAVTLVTDATRAAAMCDNPRWRDIIKKLSYGL